MGNGGTLTFHAATRLALDLPSGRTGPAIRSSTNSRLLPNSTEPVAVATAVWRMIYGDDEAIERGFDDPSREAAVNFVVALVQEVEGRLLEGGVDDPAALVREIADQAVPTGPADRGQLCEQFGIQVPADGLAGEWLFSLARDLCAAITANVMPILMVSQPLTRAEAFSRAREMKDLALSPIGRVSTHQAVPDAEPQAAGVAEEHEAERAAAALEAELEAAWVAAEREAAHLESARVAVERETARVAAEEEAARVAAAEEAARVAVELEVARLAAEQEAARMAAAEYATRMAAEQEAARVAAELEAARVAAAEWEEAARITAELEAVKAAQVAAAQVVEELEALEAARVAVETAWQPHEVVDSIPAHVMDEMQTTGVAARGASSTGNKAIAGLFAGAAVLFALSRRAKRRASS